MPIIASKDVRAQVLLDYFVEEHQVTISTSVVPTLIFTDVKPSLACVYFDEISQLEDVASKLQKVQSSFKNCFCVIVTAKVSARWLEALWSLEPGNMRCYFVSTVQEASSIIVDNLARYRSTEKSELRLNFFKQEAESLVSVVTARDLALEALGRMGVNERDASLLCESFCSIARIVAAPGSIIGSDCPVEDDACGQKMDAIFGV